MPGAGKSTIAEGLKPRGYDVINMGNAVREEAKKRNVEPTRTNLGKLMLELREKNGCWRVWSAPAKRHCIGRWRAG